MPFMYCFYPFILFPEPEYWMKYEVNSNVLRIQEINLNVKGILNSVQNGAELCYKLNIFNESLMSTTAYCYSLWNQR